MLIREYTEADQLIVIDLLKRALGELSSPKTDQNWRWKHEKNPFGRSPVLLAEVNGSIAGVRAMMKWQWQKNNVKMESLRAVDTATDPSCQGRGVFTKLTKRMLADAKEMGAGFIFNTPNNSSKPGYIKMGWRELGKLKVGFALRYVNVSGISEYDGKLNEDQLRQICTAWNKRMGESGKLFTPKSVEYLTWRYHNNPIVDYKVFQTRDFFLAVHVRQRRYFRELRVSEFIWADVSLSTKRNAWTVVQYLATRNRARLISFSPLAANICCTGFRFSLPIGPILTFYPIHSAELLKADDFAYQIGDLELF